MRQFLNVLTLLEEVQSIIMLFKSPEILKTESLLQVVKEQEQLTNQIKHGKALLLIS